MTFVDDKQVDTFGILAQLGEHLPYKQRVTGSSPVGPIRGGIAQLARARGSYPRCRGFESPSRYYKKTGLLSGFFIFILKLIFSLFQTAFSSLSDLPIIVS